MTTSIKQPTMDRNEKLLLLQLILEDIRGNWGWDVEPRLAYALKLAQELALPEHVSRIEAAMAHQQEGELDGRLFRCQWSWGGYEDGEQIHGLPSTIGNRSRDFQKAALGILTYPFYRFDDWEEYEEDV